MQGPAEYEVLEGVLGLDFDYDSPDTLAEAERWVLLAQINSDGKTGMCWGDCGVLYWFIRTDDLAARRFERARFTWQCT